MLDFVKSELRRNIATLEENAKISNEYYNNFIRLFLTIEEARDLLKAIEHYNVERSRFVS